MRTDLVFTCDGCDDTRKADAATAVIVQCGGAHDAPVTLVVTCPECGATKAQTNPDALLLAAPFVTWVRLDCDLAAGVRTRPSLTETEVRSFVARLDCTPDGRYPATSRPGQRVALRLVWTELALDGATS